MNSRRRAQLRQVLNELDVICARTERLQEDEEDAFDNLPDGIQDSERGVKMQEVAEILEKAVEAIEEAQNFIKEAIA